MEDVLEILLRAYPRLDIRIHGDANHVLFDFGIHTLELPCRVHSLVERVEDGLRYLSAWIILPVETCSSRHQCDYACQCADAHNAVLAKLALVLTKEEITRLECIARRRISELPNVCLRREHFIGIPR